MVETSSPNTSEITRGIIDAACALVSSSKGTIPMIVVLVDIKIGLVRERLALPAALITARPSCRNLLIASISRIELFTTIPANDAAPINDGIEISNPITTCPQIEPIRASGIAIITISGTM